ncbi:MAG TPA: hypothetical protein VKY85_07570 [Candidatus Angelobacter sp.]|nr:hypothetical protein [Candidatus Angelobacter sp.]
MIRPQPGGLTGWLQDLRADVTHGSDLTFPGKVLKSMGAKGTETGTSPGAAAMIGGPAVGPVDVAGGLNQVGHGNIRRGVNQTMQGVGESVALPLAATNPEFLALAAPATAAQTGATKLIQKMGADPETAQFLTNVAGIGLGAYMGMRSAKVPDYETWRDQNFPKNAAGNYEGPSGTQYTEAQLSSIHDTLSRQAGNPLISRLFAGPKSTAADFMTWRGQNFRYNENSGFWESPSGNAYTGEALRAMYDQKSSVQPGLTDTAIQTVKDAGQTTTALVKSGADIARHNPVTNTVIGMDPESLTPVQAFTKATKPRNSIQNFGDHVERALPDARRALDTLGIDPANMTLQDAETAVTQAKKDVWSEFENNHLNPNANVSLDASPVAQRINAVVDKMTDIQKRRLGSAVDDIQDAAADYDGQQMTVAKVEDRIQELNNQLRSQQAQFKVNEMGLRRDPKFAPLYAELDGLRQLESDAFGQLSGPEAAELKQRYGSLKVLQDVIDRRINVAERQNPAGLYETAGRMQGLGDIAGGIVGREPGRVAAGMVKLRAGQNAAKLNNPDFLIQQAFSKTEPSAPTVWEGEYEPPPPKGLLGPGPIITPPPADSSGSVDFTPPATGVGTRESRLGLLLPQRTAIEAPPSSYFSNLTSEPPAFDNTTRAQRLGLQEEEPAPVAGSLAELRSKTRLVQDPVTKRMVRVPDNSVDNASGSATISEGSTSDASAQNGTAAAGRSLQESRGTSAPIAGGGETSIPVPGEDRSYPAHYQVRELADIQASHSGVTFQPNSKYALTNDRDYANAVNQGKVISNSAPGRFDPAFHITDNPDATNGPIVIDSRGNALGGNGRAMILDRVYRYNPDGATAYKNLLIKKAGQFGVDPQTIEGMKQPVLVREIDDSEFDGSAGKQGAVTDFNKVGRAELTPAERAVTDSRRVSQGTLDDIAGRLDAAGPDAKLTDVLNDKSGLQVLDRLTNDGVISPQERAAYAGQTELTEAGKQRISKLLVGRYFRDPAQIESTPVTVRTKLERMVAPLSRVDGVPQWDIGPDVQQAVDLLEDVRTHGAQSIDDLLRQQSMFGHEKYSPEAVTLAKHLQSTSPTTLGLKVRQYVRDAADSQRPLLGGPTIGPEQAFDEAFGSKP